MAPYNMSGSSQVQGVIVQLPGVNHIQQIPKIQKQVPVSMPTAPGYTSNHLQYSSVRAKIASQAYSQSSEPVIVVEVQMVQMPIGRTKCILIGV